MSNWLKGWIQNNINWKDAKFSREYTKEDIEEMSKIMYSKDIETEKLIETIEVDETT